MNYRKISGGLLFVLVVSLIIFGFQQYILRDKEEKREKERKLELEEKALEEYRINNRKIKYRIEPQLINNDTFDLVYTDGSYDRYYVHLIAEPNVNLIRICSFLDFYNIEYRNDVDGMYLTGVADSLEFQRDLGFIQNFSGSHNVLKIITPKPIRVFREILVKDDLK